MRTFVRSLLVLVFACLAVAQVALAQVPYVNNTTSTPIPGTGHDYIKMLNETVNPANGSLSVRIEAPVPPDRAFTLPYLLFDYDSNGQQVPVPEIVTNTGGVGYTPVLRQVLWTSSPPTIPGQVDIQLTELNYDQQPGPGATCDIQTGYVYTDSFGVRHNLHLQQTNSVSGLGCTYFGVADHLNGGDSQYKP